MAGNEDQDEWSSNSNEAVNISIIRAGADAPTTVSKFHPQFTYPIFGEQESIFGYAGLNVDMRFAAHDLYPNVEIKYEKKYKPVGDTAATDIEKVLKPWMPSSAFASLSSYESRIQSDSGARDFTPPGKLIKSYTSNARSFEIWYGELSDEAVRKLIERMQIFISFFIEAGTPLELDDQEWTLQRWNVYFVFEKFRAPPTPMASSYSIVGYSTSYRFLPYVPVFDSSVDPKTGKQMTAPMQTFNLSDLPSILPSSLPSRTRVSQFLILPPHQNDSHGTHLYNIMVQTFLSDSSCTEITVEDPNEAFDDLRDYCDYISLLRNRSLNPIKLNTSLDPKITARRIGVRVPTSKLVDKSLLESLRLKNKLAPRQFARLVEMYLLSTIPKRSRESGTARLTQRAKASDEGDRAFYYWRLLVKQRIYKKNKESLMQLERTERVDKVEETLGGVIGDYERLLRGVEKRLSNEALGGEDEDPGSGIAGKKDRGKRKTVVDEEDDEDPTVQDQESGKKEAKRLKLVDAE